jgi:hypothetical protein
MGEALCDQQLGGGCGEREPPNLTHLCKRFHLKQRCNRWSLHLRQSAANLITKACFDRVQRLPRVFRMLRTRFQLDNSNDRIYCSKNPIFDHTFCPHTCFKGRCKCVKDGKYSEKFSPKIDYVVCFWYVAIILSKSPSNVSLHLRESDQNQREYRTRTRLIKNKNNQKKLSKKTTCTVPFHCDLFRFDHCSYSCTAFSVAERRDHG